MLPVTEIPKQATRVRLPPERVSVTHKFSVGGHEGYLTVGLFESGRPGELFITMSKQGSTVSGLMDGIAQLFSMNLQHGVPLSTLTKRFIGMRFEPSGFTGHHNISHASSILDYIGKWLDLRFGDKNENETTAS